MQWWLRDPPPDRVVMHAYPMHHSDLLVWSTHVPPSLPYLPLPFPMWAHELLTWRFGWYLYPTIPYPCPTFSPIFTTYNYFLCIFMSRNTWLNGHILTWVNIKKNNVPTLFSFIRWYRLAFPEEGYHQIYIIVKEEKHPTPISFLNGLVKARRWWTFSLTLYKDHREP